MLSPNSESFTTNKLIVIVRNPADVITSLSHLTLTGSQYLKVKERLNAKFPEFWDNFVTERVTELKQYFKTTIEIAKNNEVPIYFVRYEELIDEPYKVMVGVYGYILGISHSQVEGSVVGERLRQLIDCE